jgi:hypothetical protein
LGAPQVGLLTAFYRQKCYGITDQRDEWERAHPAERIRIASGFVLLALDPDEKTKKEHEHDLDCIRRQKLQELLELLGHDLASPIEKEASAGFKPVPKGIDHGIHEIHPKSPHHY